MECATQSTPPHSADTCYVHTHMAGVYVHRLPKALEDALQALYIQSQPFWKWCIKFIRTLYEVIDEHWSKGEWDVPMVEVDLKDTPEIRLSQDDLWSDLGSISSGIALLIFKKEGLSDEIKEKNLYIKNDWIIGDNLMTLVFSMVPKQRTV